MADHMTWVAFTNDQMDELRAILEHSAHCPATVAGLLKRLDQYESDATKDRRFREAAENLSWVREGECEIDDCAVVSQSEDGAYVMAWCWVERSDVEPGYIPTYLREGEEA